MVISILVLGSQKWPYLDMMVDPGKICIVLPATLVSDKRMHFDSDL